MGTVTMLQREGALPAPAERTVGKGQVVLVVEDRPRLSRTVGYICDFLSLPMECVSTGSDLGAILAAWQPMAVICELDGGAQDGCHVMKLVAAHDAALPILLVTGSDATLIGAAEAVEEIWHLSGVVKLQDAPGLGDVVEFLFRAGRFGGSSNLLSV
jgi:DNA-binding LytR/AlgR family response regulator